MYQQVHYFRGQVRSFTFTVTFGKVKGLILTRAFKDTDYFTGKYTKTLIMDSTRKERITPGSTTKINQFNRWWSLKIF